MKFQTLLRMCVPTHVFGEVSGGIYCTGGGWLNIGMFAGEGASMGHWTTQTSTWKTTWQRDNFHRRTQNFFTQLEFQGGGGAGVSILTHQRKRFHSQLGLWFQPLICKSLVPFQISPNPRSSTHWIKGWRFSQCENHLKCEIPNSCENVCTQ